MLPQDIFTKFVCSLLPVDVPCPIVKVNSSKVSVVVVWVSFHSMSHRELTYQSVARDATGDELSNQALTIKLSVISESYISSKSTTIFSVIGCAWQVKMNPSSTSSSDNE